MEHIFHEKQEGALCAQHCLNAVLQGPYYTAVDLADLAQQLDEEERTRMAEGQEGANDPNYQRFLAQPSANMDDTGFFSLQVLTKAIEVWGLELINLNSADPRAVAARRDPLSQSAYICNYREHWFTIRKLGLQWFDLNSLLTAAALITDTYLSMFLAQLQTEGYSIYVVCGALPDCAADQILRHSPAIQPQRPKLMSAEEVRGVPVGISVGGAYGGAPGAAALVEDEDAALQQAMALSLAQLQEGQGAAAASSNEDEDLKLALQLSQSMMSSPRKSHLDDQSHALSEEDDIQRAIQMSLKSRQEDNETKRAMANSTPGDRFPSRKGSELKRDAHAASVISPPAPPRPSKIPPSTGVTSPSAPKSSRTRLNTSGEIGSNIIGLHGSPAGPDASPASPSNVGVKPFSPPTPSQMQSATHSLGHRSPLAPTPDISNVTTRPQLRHFGRGTEAVLGERLGGQGRGLRQSTPDPEEVRQRRLAFLDKMANKEEGS